MARNLTLSSKGLDGSSASSSTRRLNCIQDWSRPLKSFCFWVVLAIELVHSAVLESLQGFSGLPHPAGRLLEKPHQTMLIGCAGTVMLKTGKKLAPVADLRSRLAWFRNGTNREQRPRIPCRLELVA